MTMRKVSKILTAVLFCVLALQTIAATLLCEGILHLTHKQLTAKTRTIAEKGARDLDAKLDDVQITSYDGTILRAWEFRPEQGNGDAVIVLHGHGDNRAGMAGFIPMLLQHHYAVLDPDARAHGESGGNIATFGIDEARDLSRWVDWLTTSNGRGCVYGLGESMGAAILLQSLSTDSRFCAVVAESPYSSFREVAYDRLAEKMGANSWVGRMLVPPLVSEAFLYARLRYGIDFDRASPVTAVSSTRVPILLIHGMEDLNIPVRHCQKILSHHSGVMEFWQVPGAGHTGAFATDPVEFENRVTEWLLKYSRKLPVTARPVALPCPYPYSKASDEVGN